MLISWLLGVMTVFSGLILKIKTWRCFSQGLILCQRGQESDVEPPYGLPTADPPFPSSSSRQENKMARFPERLRGPIKM